jgi:hypothetical protein
MKINKGTPFGRLRVRYKGATTEMRNGFITL